MASFLDLATEAFRRYAPGIATSAGTLATAGFWRALQDGSALPAMPHVALQVPAVFGEQVLVDERFVTAAHDQGLAVHVWTINEEAEMARLSTWGWTGSSPIDPPRWWRYSIPGTPPGSGEAGRLSPGRRWAACRGWPSSWP